MRFTPPTPSPMPTSTRSPRSRAKLEALLAATDGHNLERRSRSPPTRCGCRPGTPMSSGFPAASGAAWRLSPAAVEARHAAARRADQPPRCGIGALARSIPRAVSGDRHRCHSRSVLPRQRRRLDPRARPRLRHSLAGQLHVLARTEGAAAAGRGTAAGRSQADARTRARGCAPIQKRGRRRARRACSVSRN